MYQTFKAIKPKKIILRTVAVYCCCFLIMTRTSFPQFLTLVDYMEKYGDLTKPSDGPQGRLYGAEQWRKLSEALNMDPSGDPRTIEKWKRVWSDLKANTKKKAAKVNRATTRTGGGPPCRIQMSDLELRVLNIIGSQAATGLNNVAEVGVELMSNTTPRDETGPLQEIDLNIHVESTLKEQATGCSSQPTSSKEKTDFTPDGEDLDNGTMPNVSPRASPSVRIVHTTQRNAPRATRRNNPRPSQVDSASRYFAESDERWRSLIDRVATEHFRLRELELQQQAQWQALFERGMNILEKGDNKK